MIKILQFLKYRESMCFLVEMLVEVFNDLRPFMFMLFLNIYIFSLINYIMEVSVFPDDYEGLNTNVYNFIYLFRLAVGDFGLVHYGPWYNGRYPEENGACNHVAVTVIWFFWLANIFISSIILLNFVIAEVSSTYERVRDSGEIFIYQKRAELNLKA